jgi:hypothetical protein
MLISPCFLYIEQRTTLLRCVKKWTAWKGLYRAQKEFACITHVRNKCVVNHPLVILLIVIFFFLMAFFSYIYFWNKCYFFDSNLNLHILRRRKKRKHKKEVWKTLSLRSLRPYATNPITHSFIHCYFITNTTCDSQ